MTDNKKFDVASEWVHVQYKEQAQFTEVYGFAGSQGSVNLEGVRLPPAGKPSKTRRSVTKPTTGINCGPARALDLSPAR